MSTRNINKIYQLIERHGTPLYICNEHKIKENISALRKHLKYKNNKIYFAAMCNNHPDILQRMKESGLGVQINSEYELRFARKTGFDPSDITFSSVGISTPLMKKLIAADIQVNVDSVEEVEKFCAQVKNRSLGIRVKIPARISIRSEGATNYFSDSNVGISEKDYDKIKIIVARSGNKITGIHGYFASNVLETKPFFEFGDFLAEVAACFPDLQYINFGSGFGVRYSERDKDFKLKNVLHYYSLLCQKVSKTFRRSITLKIEPGRSLLASAGVLVVRVTNIKKLSSRKSEISVDGGFAEFARPRIYDSYHEIEKLKMTGKTKKMYDVRGNSVLQNDFLGRNRLLEEVCEDDFLLIKNVGAYGIVMASGFPGKKIPRQVLSNAF